MPSEPMPAPGDASGETASGETEKDFAKALWDLRESCRLFGEARIRNARRGASEEAAREHNDALDRAKRDWDEVMRLYRAAAGEVVGTGYIATSIDGGIDFYAQSWALTGDKLDPIRGLNVLVVRRDEEGVCE